jgi:GNAT superfamily N-acetyltransferase
LREVALLYTGSSPPTLLALTDDPPAMIRLLEGIESHLPAKLYAHLSPGVEAAFAKTRRLESHGAFHKMGLMDPGRIGGVDVSGVVGLSPSDADDLARFYDACYPGHWFDPRILETGFYFGLRRGGEIVSAAGVHVVSERYRVAALGNIATHPDRRGRGLATAVTARLCGALLGVADHIGLNVSASNAAAIRCYESLGFAKTAEYGEYSIEAVRGG